MRITRLTAIVACIIAFVQVAFAADPTIRLRFEIDTLRGYICLQARVNDNREPEWFIFDTGANFALGLHSRAASRLNIIPIAEPEFTNSCACRIPPLPAFSPLVKGGEGRGEGGFNPCAFTNAGRSIDITYAPTLAG